MASISNKIFNNPDAGIYRNRPKVSTLDSVSTSLPTSKNPTVDGISLLNGNRVLFTNLSNPNLNNRVYEVNGIGYNVVFTEAIDNTISQGAAIDGDLIFVQQGNTYGETLWTFDGSIWSQLQIDLGISSIHIDGSNSPTANINWNDNKITNLANPTVSTDAANKSYVDAMTSSAINSLTGDVSATGPGVAAATVNSVGGSTAANIHSAELEANAATNIDTASTIVKRDSSGYVELTGIQDNSGELAVDIANRQLKDNTQAAQLTWNTTGISTNNNLSANGSITSNTQFQGPNGTLTQPTYSFTSVTNSGIYLDNQTNKTIGLVINGVEAAQIISSGINLPIYSSISWTNGSLPTNTTQVVSLYSDDSSLIVYNTNTPGNKTCSFHDSVVENYVPMDFYPDNTLDLGVGPFGTRRPANIYAGTSMQSPMYAAPGYQYVTSAGTINNNISFYILDPSSILSTATITMPASPVDGQELTIAFGNTSGGTTVTTLTISPNSNQTVNGPPVTAPSNSFIKYLYDISNTTWYRVG